MTSRDLVVHTLCHHPVERVARELWASPRLELLDKDDLEEMCFRYPGDLQQPDFQAPRGKRARGTPGRGARYTDAWGCTWRAASPGASGEVCEPPLADLALAPGYRPPFELFEKLSPAHVNRSCAATSRFVLAHSDVRPFERLQFLHGAEATRVDLACGNRALLELLRVVHEHYVREIEWWAATDVDGVALRDDWGTEAGPSLPLDAWRDLFQPLYRQYCDILRARDKYVFFQSAGNVAPLLEDLIETGVDAVDCDLLMMDLDGLAGRFRGKVTFWGGIAPRRVACATPGECREMVRRVRKALDFGQGGVIAKCAWDPATRFENVAAVFEEWCQPVPACF